MMSETTTRRKLARKGYRLVSQRDGYGRKGYMIADSHNFIVGGSDHCLMSLEDIVENGWLDYDDE